MRIVQVASEMAPIAKVGGLGDVLMGLSRELVWQGHEVTAVIPRYGVIDFSRLQYTGRVDSFDSYFCGSWHRSHVEHFLLDGSVRVALLDTDWGTWRSRSGIYGAMHEDVQRFLQFSRAVIDWLFSLPYTLPDIIHIHDWQTAVLAPLFKRPDISERVSRSASTKIIMTLHNLEYQGQCDIAELSKVGVDIHDSHIRACAQDPQHQCANILKMGILNSDIITTVSPTYASEVLKADGGRGLEGVLRSKRSAFRGILNGVDYSFWNPHIDRFLPVQYQASDGGESVLRAKEENKRELYRILGLPLSLETSRRPLIATVTRLVEQKGLHLIQSVLERAEELDIDCIVLGSTQDDTTYQCFQKLDSRLRAGARGAVLLQNNEKLAHMIFAAADIFLVPSMFEPCGLTQIIALKYGAIPVVRRTGGLADTIVDVDYPKPSSQVAESNGFSFDHPDVGGIDSALQRALSYFREKPAYWQEIVMKAMSADFSWHKPASLYLALYQEAISC